MCAAPDPLLVKQSMLDWGRWRPVQRWRPVSNRRRGASPPLRSMAAPRSSTASSRPGHVPKAGPVAPSMARRSAASATSRGWGGRPSTSSTAARVVAAQSTRSDATGIWTAWSGAAPRTRLPVNVTTIRGRVSRQPSRRVARGLWGTPRRSANSRMPPSPSRTKPTCSGRAVASSASRAHSERCWWRLRGAVRRRDGARDKPAAIQRMIDRGTRESGVRPASPWMASKRDANAPYSKGSCPRPRGSSSVGVVTSGTVLPSRRPPDDHQKTRS